MKHNIPDELLDMPLWTLLDHLQAPATVGAGLRKWARQAPPEELTDSRATLRRLLEKSFPVRYVLLYRGMGRLSAKWLFDLLAARYQLELVHDWTEHVPDQRPLNVLLERLQIVENQLGLLKSEWRSLKAIIGGKQRRKA